MVTDPEIIDVHVHLTRDPAQERAVYGRPGEPESWYRKNGERLGEHLFVEGLSRVFAINMMDTTRMLRARLARLAPEARADIETRARLEADLVDGLDRYNAWVCDLARREKRIVPFVHVDIGVYHDQDAMMKAADTFTKAGVKGVKIHPGLDRILPGDERMFPLYDLLQEAGVAILSDSGALVGPPADAAAGPPASSRGAAGEEVVFGEPLNFVPVFENFPRLKFIMAHACSAFWDEREYIADRFPAVHFDTAGGFHSATFHARDGHRACPVEDAPRFLRRLGTHRVLFGSDGEPHDQLRQLFGLPLSDAEKGQILARNARELMSL